MTAISCRFVLALLLLATAVCNSSSQDASTEPTATNIKAECTLDNDGTCASTVASTTQGEETKATEEDDGSCGVYMGPSTLGEDSNLGIYAGKPLKPDDVVNFPEIAVPLLFREWGRHRRGFKDGALWERYIWEGDVMEIETYTDTNRDDTRSVFVPGVGCTINGVADMNNIESTHGSIYDTVKLHRKSDPGAGAFTPYHQATSVALRDIPAGGELFAAYGGEWIVDIPGAQITLEDELNTAELFLTQEYYPFVKKHSKIFSPELKEKLWNLTRNFPVLDDALSNLPRVEWKRVETMIEDGSAYEEEDYSVVRTIMRQLSVRSVEWLEENAYCQDHIIGKPSTLPQAGYGAFASRNLKAGTVVGYAPLIHVGTDGYNLFAIDYKTNLEVEQSTKRPRSKRRNGGGQAAIRIPGAETEGDRKQYDLIINYSFGHPDSSVLLTPYGAGVLYINHNKTQANVEVRWPEKELVAHKPEWLEKDVEFLHNTRDKIGLSFEYVLTKDVKAGDELFMDYGQEWEDAWNKHVKEWKPLPGAEKYVHSTDWNEPYLRTKNELMTDPYPSNLVTLCEPSYTELPDGSYQYIDPSRSTAKRVYCHVLERKIDEELVEALKRKKEADKDSEEKEEELDYVPYLYTVQLELENGETVVVEDYDNSGIDLYDAAFTNDWHLPNSFRHPIMIPDNVMPKTWRNGPPEKPI